MTGLCLDFHDRGHPFLDRQPNPGRDSAQQAKLHPEAMARDADNVGCHGYSINSQHLHADTPTGD